MDLTEFEVQADRDGVLCLLHHPCRLEVDTNCAFITVEQIKTWVDRHVCRTVIDGQAATP